MWASEQRGGGFLGGMLLILPSVSAWFGIALPFWICCSSLCGKPVFINLNNSYASTTTDSIIHECRGACILQISPKYLVSQDCTFHLLWNGNVCLGCPRVFRLVFTTTNSSGSTQKDDSSVQWNPSVEFRESLAPVFINRKTNQVFKHRHPLAHFAYSELKTWCDIFIYLRWRDLHDCVCSTNSLNSLAPGASVSLQSINCISNLFLRGGSDTQNSH